MADELRQRADDRIPDVTGRVALIERSILVVLVIGLLVGVLAVVKPFTTAVLFGAALATASWRIRRALVRRRLGRRTAAAMLLLVALVVLVIPMVVVAPHRDLYRRALGGEGSTDRTGRRRNGGFVGAGNSRPAVAQRCCHCCDLCWGSPLARISQTG